MSEQDATLDEFADTDSAAENGTENKGADTHPRFGKLPSKWAVKEIADVAEVVGGSTPSTNNEDYWGGGIPWATPTDITGLSGNIIEKTADTLTREGLESASTHLLPPHSVLMTSRATIGECAVNAVEMATNQGFKSLIPNDGIEGWYLHYRMLDTAAYLESLGSGSTFDEVSKSVVETVEIPVPPLEEQRKIASVLYTVDQAIQKTDQVVEQAERVKKGVIQENILDRISKAESPTELGEVPDDWERARLEDIADEQEDSLVDGPFGSSLKAEEFVEDGFARVIQLQNVKEGWYSDSNIRYVDKQTYEELERHSAKPGDLYIAKMASPVARACILPDTYDHYMLGCADVVKLIPNEEFVDEFVMYCLNSYPVWKQAAAHIRGSGRLRVNLNQLKEVELPKPPRRQQEKIVSAINGITDYIELHKTEKERLQRLKKGLMQDLLSGEVRTHDKDIEVVDDVLQYG